MASTAIHSGASTTRWDFEALFGRYPATVCIVTTLAGEQPAGTTCTAVMALSPTPPTLLVSFMNSSNTLRHISGSGTFGVNVMGVGGEHAVWRFATKARNKFDGVLWHTPDGSVSGDGVMLSKGVIGYAECSVDSVVEVEDHALVVGRISDVVQGDVNIPLLYAERKMWYPSALTVDATSRD